VREATIALELQGVVEVRGGSGIYVTQAPAAPIVQPGFMPATEPGPFELLRARCLIESEIASVAAETRKDGDLDRIFSALADMRENIDDKEANEAADQLFHLRIAESTGNSVLLQMVTAMWAQDRTPLPHTRAAAGLACRPPAHLQGPARPRPGGRPCRHAGSSGTRHQ
jgi:DNA-binding FadR family transcriptional regulator